MPGAKLGMYDDVAHRALQSGPSRNDETCVVPIGCGLGGDHTLF
jgi:hypothetical protein